MSLITSQDKINSDREVASDVNTSSTRIDQLVITNERIARLASQNATEAHIKLNDFEMGLKSKPSTSTHDKFLLGVTKQLVEESQATRYDADLARIKYLLLQDICDIFQKHLTTQKESGLPIDMESLQNEIIIKLDRIFKDG